MLTIAYHVIYAWYLAIRPADRRRHVPFILRGLTVASEAGIHAKSRKPPGNTSGPLELDEQQYACIDMLARFMCINPAARMCHLQAVATTNTGMDTETPDHTISTGLAEGGTWLIGSILVSYRPMLEKKDRRAHNTTALRNTDFDLPTVGKGPTEPTTLWGDWKRGFRRKGTGTLYRV